jgi:hypothetical protein
LKGPDAVPAAKVLLADFFARRDANASLTVIGVEQPASEGPLNPLAALLNDITPAQVRRKAVATTSLAVAAALPLHALLACAWATEPVPCRLLPQDIVDLLKMPTCWGKPRQFLVEQLGNRFGRTFANHWDFVRFAREQHLDIDFTSPPKRPTQSLSIGEMFR